MADALRWVVLTHRGVSRRFQLATRSAQRLHRTTSQADPTIETEPI